MSADERRLVEYLEHVGAAAARVQRYVGEKNQSEFLADELLQDAVVRKLEVIGEASRNIETRFAEFALAHPDLPLAAAYQMRNAIARGYHKVDLAIVWRSIVDDLPRLHANVRAALADLVTKP